LLMFHDRHDSSQHATQTLRLLSLLKWTFIWLNFISSNGI
jgi:hypothetical protein